MKHALLAGALFGTLWAALSGQNAVAPVHFAYRPIDFRLDSSETPQRHAPETMAGGVAVFDYNNDGHLDIFFANGADIRTLQKTSPKYSNRLFENDGNGNFKDVTERAGLAGAGFDNGVAVGDYDNDGYEDIFVGGVHGNRLYHNNGNGTFTDVTHQAGLDKPDTPVRPFVVGRRGLGGREQRRVCWTCSWSTIWPGTSTPSRPARQRPGSSTTAIRSSTSRPRTSCS